MHIHIPDGILPVWLWALGLVITSIVLLIILPLLRKQTSKIPLVGMLTAIALLVMSIPLGLPVHINLMILIGIIAGGQWSLVIALLVNIILAFFGHGGITIIGLNTILLWIQALTGIFLFRLLARVVKNYFISASLSSFLSLALSFAMLIFIVGASRVNPQEFIHHEESEHSFEESGDAGLDEHRGAESANNHAEELDHTEISLLTFTSLSLPVAAVGILVESIITGFVVQFLSRVKPDLLKNSKKKNEQYLFD